MTLGRADFDAFFTALHDGQKPFTWQRRLLDTVLDDGWPDALVAPTGSGKTAAIDVHVFALAVAAANGSLLPPRRLAMIVARRVLVDDQYRHALTIAKRLAEPTASPIVAEVAEVLWQLQADIRSPHDDSDSPQSPLLVARLRGGLPPSRRWTDHPTAAAVLCATPDMWGSRLLFRGYGSSPRAWPREAGLLAVDTVALVDEAHLSRQLVRTARRVGELVPVAERKWDGPPVLQVVETTATPDDTTANRLGVEDDDLADSATLEARLRRPKPVTLLPSKDWATTLAPSKGSATSTPRARVAEKLARQTVGLLDASNGRTVGCFVNTVDRAVSVTAALQDTKITGRELTVVMVCGQVRPIDIELLEQRYPGLLTPQGNAEVDVIISTQSLEVGVDLDLAGMVTELASGSALAQRAGRINRLGRRETGPIVVIVPDGTIRPAARSGPYGSEELVAAHEWIERRANDSRRGLAPWALREDPAPAAGPRRTLLQRPELGQVWHWARTSDDLAADPELDLWLSDDLAPESAVGIAMRHDLPEDLTEAVELITFLPPRPHEIFAVPLNRARDALADAGARAGEPDRHVPLPAVLVRGDDIGPLDWATTDNGRRPRIRPGDIVVLDAATPLFTASHSGDHRTPPVLAPAGEVPLHPAEDVLEATADLGRDLRSGEVVHRIDLDTAPSLAELLSLTQDDPEVQPLDEREIVRDWLHDHGNGRMALAAAALLRDADRTVDVMVQRDTEDVPVRALVIDGRRAVADEYVRQEWTPNPKPVRLDPHQRAVADRVGEMAGQLGLSDELTAALREAALHHDDGKADPRFQIRLGARSPEPWAKSQDLDTPEKVRHRRDRSDLPPYWRHEQRSVVDAWPAIPADLDRDLVARLIGTTHGHGRSWFPHTSSELLGAHDGPETREVAEMLFDEGGWDELIERTQLRYGAWGCAYLEALLRAADGRISAEGK
jgi:CRISPR-associated endonuclease/helicase Cas3